jgi:hypothetical protein
MKLSDTFPEIEAFFNKKSFDSDELISLISLLNKRYKGKDLIKAKSIFDLKVLGYELKSNGAKVLNQDNNKKNTIHKNYIKFNLNNKLELELEDKISIDKKTKYIQNSINYNVNNIATKLEWSIRYVQYLIEIKTGVKGATTIDGSEYLLCKDAFDSRVRALSKRRKRERLAKIKLKINNQNTSANNSSGVWDSVLKYGLGKVIYIRSK